MAISILPCPFCGSLRLHIVHHLLTQGVTCESCKAQGPHCRRMEDAVVEWNATSKKLEQMTLMNEHFLHSHLNTRKATIPKKKEAVKE